MRAIAYALFAAAVWVWVEYPFLVAVLGALAIGAVGGYAYRGLRTAPVASESVTEASSGPQPNMLSRLDRDLDRLVTMGFRAEEVRPLLTKARMKGDPDPYGYVMRALVR